jgi:hypothetical protein
VPSGELSISYALETQIAPADLWREIVPLLGFLVTGSKSRYKGTGVQRVSKTVLQLLKLIYIYSGDMYSV